MKLFEVRHTANLSIFDQDKERVAQMFKVLQEIPEARLVDSGFVLYNSKEEATKAIEILRAYGFVGQTREIEVAEDEAEDDRDEEE